MDFQQHVGHFSNTPRLTLHLPDGTKYTVRDASEAAVVDEFAKASLVKQSKKISCEAFGRRHQCIKGRKTEQRDGSAQYWLERPLPVVSIWFDVGRFDSRRFGTSAEGEFDPRAAGKRTPYQYKRPSLDTFAKLASGFDLMPFYYGTYSYELIENVADGEQAYSDVLNWLNSQPSSPRSKCKMDDGVGACPILLRYSSTDESGVAYCKVEYAPKFEAPPSGCVRLPFEKNGKKYLAAFVSPYHGVGGDAEGGMCFIPDVPLRQIKNAVISAMAAGEFNIALGNPIERPEYISLNGTQEMESSPFFGDKFKQQLTIKVSISQNYLAANFWVKLSPRKAGENHFEPSATARKAFANRLAKHLERSLSTSLKGKVECIADW